MHVSLQSSLRFYQVLNQRWHAIHDEGCSKEETLVATSVIVNISDRTSKVQVQREVTFMCCTSIPALCSSGNEPAAYHSHTQRSPDMAPLVGNELAAYHSHTQRSLTWHPWLATSRWHTTATRKGPLTRQPWFLPASVIYFPHAFSPSC